MGFAKDFLEETARVAATLDAGALEAMAEGLAEARQRGGRLFILGVGGSAASASHAVNDFRKLAGFEAYCPADNVSELTARVNDEGWATTFAEWLKGSRLDAKDALLVLSVGGGDAERGISPNLVRAIDLAKEKGSAVFGIVGRDGGYTAKKADVCAIVPTVESGRVTPHTEAFHSVLCHLLVSHPKLQVRAGKWESEGK